MTAPTERILETRQGRLGALAWPRPNAPRVLCLHGWLDNAASFAPLADELEDLDRVALDLPGHGHSEHRHATTRYHFVDYLFDVDAALDALGWADAHFIGHSMGAAIACCYAAGAPARVRSLILLDGLGPMTSASERTAERLRRSLARHRESRRPARRYASMDEMVAARRAATPYLSESAARLLCRRSAREEGDGWRWRSDPALNGVSALVMTEPQVLDLLGHISAPTLAFQALPASPWMPPEQVQGRRAALPHGRYETIEGHHHFHMDAPGAIAPAVRSFIAEHDQPPGEPRPHE